VLSHSGAGTAAGDDGDALVCSAGALAAARSTLTPADEAARAEALALSDRLTKPPGALGQLEELGAQLAAIAGACPPPVPEPAVVAVFAADHGVVDEGVTPWPREVTAQMVANFGRGGAAVNVLARHAGASVVVVDVGVAGVTGPAPGLVVAKVAPGTANLAAGPAMTLAQCRAALDVGAWVAARMVAERAASCLITGDMGIGNTTASAALVAALCRRPAGEVTGRGTGVDDDGLARKTAVVERASERARQRAAGAAGSAGAALEVLADVGGLEIAALAGYIVGAAAARVPVVVDGVVACAALVVAAALAPGVVPFCVAGHRSTEPAAAAALEHVGLRPLLDLGLRLGEGTGACLALGLVQASAKVLREMATFDAAGVTDKR
jgi:nicotinate-nucleotide--dimethylbenzimidazole phosphoribosyltransferase